MLTRSALVVAHPDDEALWFSSIAGKVERLIVCFLEVDGRPDVTAGRRRAAASVLGFDLWFSNYGSNRSHNLMLRYLTEFRSDYVTFETNRDLATSLEELYRAHGCWTWPYDDYQQFTHECFIRAKDTAPGAEDGRHGHLFSLNFLRMEVPWEEPQEERPGLVGRVTRKLRAIGGARRIHR